jgi:DNA-binding GntR family transcriptional regulator
VPGVYRAGDRLPEVALTAELAAGQQFAGRLAPAALANLEGKAAQLERVTATGDLERAVDLNRQFHLRSAELSGNPIALEMLDRLWNQLMVSARASLERAGRPHEVAGEHRELLAAISRRVAQAGARLVLHRQFGQLPGALRSGLRLIRREAGQARGGSGCLGS